MQGRVIIWIVIGVLVLSGFVVKGYLSANTKSIVTDPATAVANAWNRRQVDSAVSLLQSGDVVIRRGMGADSYVLAQMNRDDKTYSHCGIVLVENGYPFVYHSIGGEDNPNETLRRDSAAFFFSPLHNTCIAIARYDLDPPQQARLTDIVHRYYKEHPKFDMNFDLATDDRLYCSEFVYKAVNGAANDSNYITPYVHAHRRIVGIDNLFRNAHAQMIEAIKFK